jgi:type III restriction enzyme
VLDAMTEQRKQGKIVAYQGKLPFGELNESVESYLVEEGKEEEQLRNLMR